MNDKYKEMADVLAWLNEPRVHLMGAKIGIFCRTGFVEAVQDASYDVTWNEHVGTDWVSIPYPLANGRWVRDDIYHHHYVQRSEKVGRNKVIVRIDGSDAEVDVLKDTDYYWFGKNVDFSPGDRVVVVVAESDRIILVNETKRFQIFTGNTYSGSPEPYDPIQKLGRSLEARSVSLAILAAVAALAWAASAVLPVVLCVLLPIAFLVVRAVAVSSWRSHRNVFARSVRDACESALKRLELVRNGMKPDKAHAEAFGDLSGMGVQVARKPWTVSVCEALGATALPPLGSRQFYEERYAIHLENKALRDRKPTEEELRTEAAALDVASREYGRAYVAHRGSVPPKLLAAIGQRQKIATRPARPDRHIRVKKKEPGVDAEWEIHWGKPKWPASEPLDQMDYVFRQLKWFDVACKNGTIPPLPPEEPKPGQPRFFLPPSRSPGNDPAYPDAVQLAWSD